jgi:thiamine-phosphate pyrophosphorylase
MWRGVYAITDSALLPNDNLLIAKVEAALRGGISMVQYRDKSSDTQKRTHQAFVLRDLCTHYRVPLIINDDVQLAIVVNADGVHLGQQDVALVQARQLLGSEKIIGITCHASLTHAKKAEANSADYVAFGSCFSSPTKPNALHVSLQTLAEAKQQLHIPVVAIGGINYENAHSIIHTGVDMIAVISSLFTQENVTQAAQQLVSLFKE